MLPYSNVKNGCQVCTHLKTRNNTHTLQLYSVAIIMDFNDTFSGRKRDTHKNK